MQRTKVFAVAVAALMAVAAAVAFAGGASAASWHVYEGDLYAGHAYGLEVPAKAESVEFVYDGPAEGRASISVFDPEGAKVGHYDLSPELTTAAVANPDAGSYVVYVYELDQGALSIRVNAEREPTLDLAEIDLAREDVSIGTFEPGALDKVVTTKLEATPVFVTLLYEGSARGLDATVASGKGPVVTITDESGTAFSPGVWTSLKGERTATPANLDGVQYTVTLHADSFEGEMVLSTLVLDLASESPAPMPLPGWPSRPSEHEHEAHRSAAVAPDARGSFAAPPERAVAFHAEAGKLLLFDPAFVEETSEDEESYQEYGYALVSLYAPDDSVLAVVELNYDEPMVEVELPVAGEYVLYTHASESEFVLAKLVDGATPTVRMLETAEETFSFEVANGILVGSADEATTFTLAHVPIAMAMSFDGFGTLTMASAANEVGDVLHGNLVAGLGGLDLDGGSADVPENFATGEHELFVSGLFEGTVEIVSTHYVRSATLEEPVEPESVEEPEDEESWLPGIPLRDLGLPW